MKGYSKEYVNSHVFQVHADDLKFLLQDLDSTNNTYVNDQRVNLHRLSEGDRIRIGTNNFNFDDSEDQRLDETAKLHKSWIPGVYYTKPKA